MTTKYKKMLVGVGCVIAFVLVVFGIMIYASNSLTKVIDNQLEAIRSDDMALAYSYTSTDFRNATSQSDFEDFINHYDALKNNKSASLSVKNVKNDVSMVQGTLYARDGSVTSMEYVLAKEEGEWKIMGIQVNPTTTPIMNGTDIHSNAMINTYDNKDSRYTIKYPASWEYEKAGDGTIIFSGKRGTSAFFSTVNIQTVLSKKTGGDYSTVKEFMTDIKHQATTQSPGVKFLESGPIEVTEKNGVKDKGEYTIFTYTYKGKEFKQWQVVVLRSDAQVFYAWAYTSPIREYPTDLDIAKAMLESWVIY